VAHTHEPTAAPCPGMRFHLKALDQREVSGVQPSLVVMPDPVLDVAARGRAVGPDGGADLGLDGREERFRRGAVEARACSARALPDLQTPQRVPVGFRMVLAGFNRSWQHRLLIPIVVGR